MPSEVLKISKKQHIVEIVVDSPLQFLRLLSPIGGLIDHEYEPDEFIYRGVATYQDTLAPAVFREGPKKDKSTKSAAEKDTNLWQIFREFDMFYHFFERADAQGRTIPEDCQMFRYKVAQWQRLFACSWVKHALEGMWDENGYGEFEREAGWKDSSSEEDRIYRWPPKEFYSTLGLMQHNLFPTRLLDWSWNSFVSAYFAAASATIYRTCRKETDNIYPCVWAVDVKEFKRRNPKPNDDDDIRLITAPASDNGNLKAQRGLFLCYTVNLLGRHLKGEIRRFLREKKKSLDYANLIVDTASGLAVNSDGEYTGTQDWKTHVYKLKLRGKDKAEDLLNARELLRLVGSFGFDASTIYPGFWGVSQSIQEKDHWWPERSEWRVYKREILGRYKGLREVLSGMKDGSSVSFSM